uniref:Uncharacterized protein n=1 Tax=Panagrolaimus davidi TaxID=227884 RepID=A0A914P2N8_9BILA
MYAYWSTKQPIPTTPCLKQKDCIQWFLVFDSDGDTAIRFKTLIRDCSYIIAEMIAENGFTLTEDLKIDVYRNF